MGKHVRFMDKYDAEIVEEKYNPLVGRLEVKLRVLHFHEGTPSRGMIKKFLSDYYGKDLNLIYVRKSCSVCGFPGTYVEAHIYDSAERARKFEPEYIFKRDEESVSKLTQSSQG
ncbi:MAG: 30S ribosomal protein S24e [Desulfurococcaceae archaeon]